MPIQEEIRLDSIAKLVQAVKDGKKFRLVGDNINFHQQIRSERKDKHSKMQHYFGSAAKVQDTNFDHLQDEAPQQAGFEMMEMMVF